MCLCVCAFSKGKSYFHYASSDGQVIQNVLDQNAVFLNCNYALEFLVTFLETYFQPSKCEFFWDWMQDVTFFFFF